MNSKDFWLLATAIFLLSAVRVASTYRVFAPVVDEPTHISAGRMWWAGVPAWEALNPPLAKILFAIPYLSQAPEHPEDRAFMPAMLLFNRPDAVSALARARMANLLFLGVAIFAIAAWARELGDAVAIVAVVLFACVPQVLGNAGLAGTDMAAAATLTLALFATDRWLRSGTWTAATLAGLAAGAGALAKLSFPLFFPLGAIVLLICERKRRTAKASQITVFALAAVIVLWAGYRFELKPLASFQSVIMPAASALSPPLRWLYTRVPIPATSYVGGLFMLRRYTEIGTLSYLFGHTTHHGWWYYFPVVFFFKTPLPFLVFAGAGVARVPLKFALIPAAVMLSALNSTIEIGVRHLLPLYPFLAIAAAAGLVCLWRQRRKAWRAAALVLAAWFIIGSAAAHPDYFAWFNEAAGPEPQRIAVDSNLDWGQDMFRLARLTRKRNFDQIALRCTTTIPFDHFGVHDTPLPPFAITKGWVAVSETILALDPDARRGGFEWLSGLPYERVGQSIRLYYVP
ncbi:MAG TPA: glycosyltransferase family 39 protein [Thermoanaerobaculia bacterium]|nr:glycosyltransferase family 39 protein [Thermoanaerobaculia bacterium]